MPAPPASPRSAGERSRRALFALLASSLFAGLAASQDSVAPPTASAPTDALEIGDFATQVTSYALDLTPLQTSSGRAFGLGVAAKLPLSAPGQAPPRPASPVISPGTLRAAEPLGPFAVWTSAGPGVNPVANDSPAFVPGPGSPLRLTAAIAGDAGDRSTAVTALIDIDRSDPTRVYVTRVATADNALTRSGPRFSALTTAAARADGFVALRADDFEVPGSGSAGLVADGIFAVDALARRPDFFNIIWDIPLYQSGTALLAEALGPVTFGPPALLPLRVNTPPAAIGTAWNGSLYRNDDLASGAAFPAAPYRGSPGIAERPLLNGQNAVAAAAVPVITPGGVPGLVRTIRVFDLTTDVTPSASADLALPAAIQTAAGGLTWDLTGTDADFGLYRTPASLRSAAGHVALRRLGATGDALLAATISGEEGQAIAVARFDPASPGSAVWTIAAHTDGVGGASSGSPVGAGRITRPATTAPAPNGGLDRMGLSSPALDAAGNLWFLASVATAGEPPAPTLVRGVLNGATGGHDFEAILREGETVRGGNSGLTYRIDRLYLQGPEPAGGPDAAGFTAASVSARTGDGAFGLVGDPTATASTAGVVLAASITYDVNGDGEFTPAGTAAGDQAYTVLLYLRGLGD